MSIEIIFLKCYSDFFSIPLVFFVCRKCIIAKCHIYKKKTKKKIKIATYLDSLNFSPGPLKRVYTGLSPVTLSFVKTSVVFEASRDLVELFHQRRLGKPRITTLISSSSTCKPYVLVCLNCIARNNLS